MPSTIPISNTNIQTLIGPESAYGVVATNGLWIAYDQNTLVRNQTLEKNVELRGNRQMGTRIPGQKNPGGTLLAHQTDKTMPLSWYAALGTITAGAIVPQGAPTATLITAAGLVTTGTHSYKYVVTNGAGGTAGSSVSNTVTTDTATHGQVTVGKPGVLPVGSTWAIYRTATGNAVTGPWVLIPSASALAAGVTSFIDDIADATLSGTWPVSFTADDNTHTITSGLTLPSFTIERKHPYVSDTAAYFAALGSVVNKSTVTVKGTGFFDMGLDFLFGTLSGPNSTSFDSSPTDWRGGEKIHHAMALAANVKLDGTPFAKFQDLKVDVMNNLDTSDYPVGGQGNRGSLVPMQAEVQVTGTLKVCEPDDLTMVQDTSVTHELSIQWDFVTATHFVKVDLFGVQFDPTDAAPSGQGILKFSANGFASQPDGGEQIIVTCCNGIPTATYTT